MKHLLIVGARGWGREVYAGAIKCKAFLNGEFDVKGFLDSKSDAFAGLKGNYPPIICAPEDYCVQKDDVFFVAMGEPRWRKYYADIIKHKGGSFISIISEKALINSTSSIGTGSFVSALSIISDNVILGEHTVIHAFSDIGHDVKVGAYSTIESYCFMGGYSELGDESIMHVRSHVLPHKKVGNLTVVGASSVVIRNVPDATHVFGNPAKKMEL